MTPTTAEPTTDLPAGDLPDIERQVERRQREIEQLRSREERLNETIATRIADGGDADDLREERRAVRERVEDLEAALDTLKGRVERLRELRERAEAEIERLAEDAREEAVTFDEATDRALADFRTAVQRCEGVLSASNRQRRRRRALRLVCQKYGIPEPETPSVPGVTGDDRLRQMVTTQPIEREGRTFTGSSPAAWAPDEVVELLHPDDG